MDEWLHGCDMSNIMDDNDGMLVLRVKPEDAHHNVQAYNKLNRTVSRESSPTMSPFYAYAMVWYYACE